MLGDEIDAERQEHVEEHVERGVVQTKAANPAYEEVGGEAEHDAYRQASEEADAEREACVRDRERAGYDCRDRELERYDARSIVDERLTLEDAALPLPDVDVLGERRDRDGIGRAERCA